MDPLEKFSHVWEGETVHVNCRLVIDPVTIPERRLSDFKFTARARFSVFKLDPADGVQLLAAWGEIPRNQG